MRIIILLGVVIFATIITEVVTGNSKKDDKKCGVCPMPCCCKCEKKHTSCSNETAPDCGCVDVVFIVDSSGSIGPKAWEDINFFLVHIVDALENKDMDCENEVHAAPIVFSTNATLQWGITDPVNYDHDQLVQAIMNIPQDLGQSNLVEGLELGIAVLMNSRPECPCMVVVLTDGIPSDRISELEDMGAALQNACDLVFCVKAKPDSNDANLAMICKTENIVGVDGFDQLNTISMNFLMDAMPTKQPCEVMEEKCSCCCPHHRMRPHRYW